MKRRKTGVLGEKLARAYLEERGYQIQETNYRCAEGEIDIVAQHGDYLVFIEVRTRTNLQFGSPEESITPAKMRRLRNVSARYLQTHRNLPPQWRIDVVALELDKNKEISRVALIENAVGDE